MNFGFRYRAVYTPLNLDNCTKEILEFRGVVFSYLGCGLRTPWAIT